MQRFKFDGRRRPDIGNRRRVDSDDEVEVFAEDITIDPSEMPDRKRRRYDAEDLLEKAEREQQTGIPDSHTDDKDEDEEEKTPQAA